MKRWVCLQQDGKQIYEKALSYLADWPHPCLVTYHAISYITVGKFHENRVYLFAFTNEFSNEKINFLRS